MDTNAFVEKLKEGDCKIAVAYKSEAITYRELYENIMRVSRRLEKHNISGTSVLLVGNYSINSICMLLALWMNKNVVALTSSENKGRIKGLADSAGARFCIYDDAKAWETRIVDTLSSNTPPNISKLISNNESGFVVFSSGSTGPAKGVVHRVNPFLERYSEAERIDSILAFLLFDHIGGLVTMLHALATHGTLVIPVERSLDEVGRCIKKYSIRTLHVSPTLLQLALISGVLHKWNTQNLQRIYYGSEPISPELIRQVEKAMPNIELRQLYGMSEIGVLPCSSRDGDSRWMNIQDPNYSVKIIDGILHVRGAMNMVGYLSDDSMLPINSYFNTSDLAEEDGGYFFVKGRSTDLINVGGSNVCPTDVERILGGIANVVDVMVYGHSNPIIGEVVAARFVLSETEDLEKFKGRVYKEIKDVLLPEEIPRVISISDSYSYTERFKKVRNTKVRAAL